MSTLPQRRHPQRLDADKDVDSTMGADRTEDEVETLDADSPTSDSLHSFLFCFLLLFALIALLSGVPLFRVLLVVYHIGVRMTTVRPILFFSSMSILYSCAFFVVHVYFLLHCPLSF